MSSCQEPDFKRRDPGEGRGWGGDPKAKGPGLSLPENRHARSPKTKGGQDAGVSSTPMGRLCVYGTRMGVKIKSGAFAVLKLQPVLFYFLASVLWRAPVSLQQPPGATLGSLNQPRRLSFPPASLLGSFPHADVGVSLKKGAFFLDRLKNGRCLP